MEKGQLYPVISLAILLITLPPNGIAYARLSHQIAFIGRINKHFGLDFQIGRWVGVIRIFDDNFPDPAVLGNDLFQSVRLFDFQVSFLDIILVDFLGYMGFESPLFEFTVMLTDFPVKILG